MLFSEHILKGRLKRVIQPFSPNTDLHHDCHCIEALFSPAAPLDPFGPAGPCIPDCPCTPGNVKTMTKNEEVFVNAWEFSY